MKFPKVLYVIGKISPEKAGAGINLHNFLKFGRKEFEARVLAIGSDISFDQDDVVNDYYRFVGLNKGTFRRILMQVVAVPRLAKHIFWSDVVHIKSIPKGMFIVSILAKVMGKKLVQEPTLVGHDDPGTFNDYKSGFLQHFCWMISDSSVFISKDVKNNSLDYNGELITRGVDLNKYNPTRDDALRREHKIDNETLVVTQIGNVSDRKNQFKTLEIVNRLQLSSKYKFVVFLVGPQDFPKYTDKLKNYAIENGIDCRFTGYTNTAEQYLKMSDLYIFPSKHEGFGVSLIQALACGLNTYTSPVGCFEELQDRGFNHVIDGGVDEWVTCIRDSLNKSGIDRLENNKLVMSFSEQNIASRLRKFYDSIL